MQQCKVMKFYFEILLVLFLFYIVIYCNNFYGHMIFITNLDQYDSRKRRGDDEGYEYDNKRSRNESYQPEMKPEPMYSLLFINPDCNFNY